MRLQNSCARTDAKDIDDLTWSLNSQGNVLPRSRDQRSFEERRRLRAELQQAIQKGELEENPWLRRKEGTFSGQAMSLL